MASSAMRDRSTCSGAKDRWSARLSRSSASVRSIARVLTAWRRSTSSPLSRFGSLRATSSSVCVIASGVRSSWEALAANLCCSATCASSRASMAVEGVGELAATRLGGPVSARRCSGCDSRAIRGDASSSSRACGCRTRPRASSRARSRPRPDRQRDPDDEPWWSASVRLADGPRSEPVRAGSVGGRTGEGPVGTSRSTRGAGGRSAHVSRARTAGGTARPRASQAQTHGPRGQWRNAGVAER